MNKLELMKKLAEVEKLNRDVSKNIVELVFQDITDALVKDKRVEIRKFGSFIIKHYDGYFGRNPKTGKRVKIKPKKLPVFKVGKEIKERVNFK